MKSPEQVPGARIDLGEVLALSGAILLALGVWMIYHPAGVLVADAELPVAGLW